jgi:hypothetical protein
MHLAFTPEYENNTSPLWKRGIEGDFSGRQPLKSPPFSKKGGGIERRIRLINHNLQNEMNIKGE